MKKLAFHGSYILFSILLVSCTEKKRTAVAVPESVITNFNSKYPGAKDVKWEEETDNGKEIYDGEFEIKGKKKEAQFDDMGNFIKEQP